MPRAVPPNFSSTCLQRKIKCDGQRPICGKCAIKGRKCVRPNPAVRFVIASPGAGAASISRQKAGPNEYETHHPQNALSISEPLRSTRKPSSSNRVHALASADPASALQDLGIAKLFAHYVTVLAAWYDLNDPKRTFTLVVPENALQDPILFKAIIAFSACHLNKLHGTYGEVATAFHAACVTDILRSMEAFATSSRSGRLAATCLLRSYELINGSLDMESHLLGAYSYATSGPIDFSQNGILQVGAWNYLREEITVALIRRRGVRMDQIFDDYMRNYPEGIHPSDTISYVLAKIINFCFANTAQQLSPRDRTVHWKSLQSELAKWNADLPASFAPFSHASKEGNPFPSIWMLQPYHVAAQQYLAISEMLLVLYDPYPEGGHLSIRSLDFAQERTMQVCGLAWTNTDEAARVNAFGPMAFCGRYLRSQKHRETLETLLSECSLATGWPVDDIVSSLREVWATN
ncbi:hypothetical protein SVAN01_09555 [Stagonosporopsis vannaccii]|nr:hypothetical protein SVAN01_09555 [Stagonosporopsis vannaccii]